MKQVACILLLAAVGLGCEAAVVPCKAGTCSGCCDDTGLCQPGTTLFACGAGAAACRACAASEACEANHCVPYGGAGGGGAAGLGGAGGDAGRDDAGSGGGGGGGGAGGSGGGGEDAGSGGGGAGGSGGTAGSGGVAGGGGGGTGGGGGVGGFGGFAGSGPGETCGDATFLTLSGSRTGTLRGAADDYRPSCTDAGLPDRVYRVELLTPGLLSAQLSAPEGSLSLRPFGCREELACSPTTNGQAVAEALLPAGSYFVVVDAPADAGFTLGALQAVAPGDTCGNALRLTFDGGVSEVFGTLVGAHDDLSPHCLDAGWDGGADIVYAFSTTTADDVTVALTGPANAAVVLQAGQCAGAELACGLGGIASVDGGLYYPSLPPGDYVLHVEGHPGSQAAPFALRTTFSAPTAPAENCATPVNLQLTSAPLTIQGSTANRRNDLQSAVCGGNGPDQVYSFTLSAPSSFSAIVAPDAGLAPVLILRSAPCSGGAELACQGPGTGVPASLTDVPLDAGTYFLWVDGTNGSSGGYTLTAAATPPIVGGSVLAGESCAVPGSITWSDGIRGVANGRGTTVGAQHDGTGCVGAGPDKVYGFRVTQPRTFTATVTPTSVGQLVIYLKQGASCDTATLVTGACVYPAAPGTSPLTFSTQLAVGTYWFWVDTWSGTGFAAPYAINLALQ